MKFVDPSFDILTDISSGGIKELKHIERCGRISYRSEDKITEDGESAKKFVAMLIRNGHESVLEHGSLTVEFTVDRAIANELVRHRMASFTQESTRYCNYSKDKFGGDVTYILPLYLKRGSILFNNLEEGLKADEEFQKLLNDPESKWAPTVFDYINFKYGGPGGMNEKSWNDICKFYNYMSLADYSSMSYRASVGRLEEKTLTYNVESTPEEARWMLPLGLATKIVVTANYREWRHIFKLRCEKHAHPEMRRIMCALWLALNTQIPVIFDDIRDMVNEYLDDDQGLMNGLVATDCVNIGLRYFRKPTIKE